MLNSKILRAIILLFFFLTAQLLLGCKGSEYSYTHHDEDLRPGLFSGESGKIALIGGAKEVSECSEDEKGCQNSLEVQDNDE